MEQDEVEYRKNKWSQTERQTRPFQYQVYEMTEKNVNIEMAVTSIANIPFNFCRKGKLKIAIKEYFKDDDDGIVTTILLGSSTCEEKINWVFKRSFLIVHLVLSLEFTDTQWHVHHINKEINIGDYSKDVTFEMLKETTKRHDYQVSLWSFVLFDKTGNTAKVRSTSLLQTPKRNESAYLVIDTTLFRVVVLEIAETEEALDKFEAEWQTTSEAIEIEKVKNTIERYSLSFIMHREMFSKLVLVLFDFGGNTDIVKSTKLLQAPKKNAIVDLVIGSESFAVLVLEIAETESELEMFKNEWQNPSSLAFITSKSDGGNIFPSSFIRYRALVNTIDKWALVMFDNDGKTRYVASAKHEPPPKMNTVVNYGFNDPRAVVVIGIADTFKKIRIFTRDWFQTSEAKLIVKKRDETAKSKTKYGRKKISFIDYREEVSQWVLVLFDIEGHTDKVRSANLLQLPKKNATVDLKIGAHSYAVVVLEVAENELELDLLSSKWKKPFSFDSFTAKSYGGSIFPSSFSRYKSRASQFALVLYDIDGKTAIVKSTNILQAPQKNAIVDLVDVNSSFTVLVLEVADNEEHLTTFEKEWLTTSEAIEIDRLKKENNSKNPMISFIGYREMLSKWVLVLFDIHSKPVTVRSSKLLQAPTKDTLVDLIFGIETFAVFVLEVAETEKELDILKQKWQQSSYRASNIVRNNLPSSFLCDRAPEEEINVFRFNISMKTAEQNVKLQGSPSLCEEEDNFVKKRRTKVYEALKRFDVNTTKENVPTIAIIGSGGGMRAVIGMGAALHELEKQRVLDGAMYIAGLSGSAWFLLSLYAFNDKKLKSNEWKVEPHEVNKHIKKKLQNKFAVYSWMALKVITYYIRSVTYDHGEYFTFTNLFGEMIGDLLLPKESTQKWSDLAKPLENGSNPLPLISALYVRDEKTLTNYNEWVEFSPYQVYIPRYGAAIDMKQFGDKFYRGCCIQKYEEQPIHYLQGICGSAYAIVRDYRPQGNEWYVEDGRFMKTSGIWLLFNKFDSAFVAKVPNFLHGISEKGKTSKNPVLRKGNQFDYLEDTITKMDKSRRCLGSTEVTRFLSKIKDSTWSFFKEFARLALDIIVVNFGYESLFRVSEEYKQRMMLVDAGIAFNSPYPSVLHPSRNVDIIISFDFSDRGDDAALPFKELKKAEKWARARGVPFPELYPTLYTIEEKWMKNDRKEVYVFPGSQSPTIIHFVMLNKSFRVTNDSISANFDEILKNKSMACLLGELKLCKVISTDEQHNIAKHLTQDKQIKAFIEMMIKKGEAAVRVLVHFLNNSDCTTLANTLKSDLQNIQNDGSNNFDILPDYGTLRFSYSEKEFDRLNRLIQHNVKENVGEIIKCIREKNIEKETTQMEEKEIIPTKFKQLGTNKARYLRWQQN